MPGGGHVDAHMGGERRHRAIGGHARTHVRIIAGAERLVGSVWPRHAGLDKKVKATIHTELL